MFVTAKFLEDHFGDPDGVLGTLGRYWHDIPQRESVRKWFSRGRIASEWWPILIVVLEMKNGEPVKLAPYCIIGDEDGVFA